MKERRYTQSEFNFIYANNLYWNTWKNDNDYKTHLKLLDEINLMLKTEKYIDGSIYPELVYIQHIDEKAGYIWKNLDLPKPNIILEDDVGMSTYIYVVDMPINCEAYGSLLTEDIKSDAFYMSVKHDYPEYLYYFDFFTDKLFSYFKNLLNAGKYSKNLENPNCMCWKPKFQNAPIYTIKDLIKFVQY